MLPSSQPSTWGDLENPGSRMTFLSPWPFYLPIQNHVLLFPTLWAIPSLLGYSQQETSRQEIQTLFLDWQTKQYYFLAIKLHHTLHVTLPREPRKESPYPGKRNKEVETLRL